eukprot:m.330806 g.330806  ORF g.330806 m.330806 type:complete len:137 (+) comp55612_c3_seq1:295-705(+)
MAVSSSSTSSENPTTEVSPTQHSDSSSSGLSTNQTIIVVACAVGGGGLLLLLLVCLCLNCTRKSTSHQFAASSTAETSTTKLNRNSIEMTGISMPPVYPESSSEPRRFGRATAWDAPSLVEFSAESQQPHVDGSDS